MNYNKIILIVKKNKYQNYLNLNKNFYLSYINLRLDTIKRLKNNNKIENSSKFLKLIKSE